LNPAPRTFQFDQSGESARDSAEIIASAGVNPAASDRKIFQLPYSETRFDQSGLFRCDLKLLPCSHPATKPGRRCAGQESNGNTGAKVGLANASVESRPPAPWIQLPENLKTGMIHVRGQSKRPAGRSIAQPRQHVAPTISTGGDPVFRTNQFHDGANA
jgi:hypothetical protein